MIVALVGGINLGKKIPVFVALDRVHRRRTITKLVTGAGTGAEGHAVQWARSRNVPHVIYRVPAHARERYIHKKLYRQRNLDILEKYKPNYVVVVPGGQQAGYMVDLARSRGIPFERLSDSASRTFVREPLEEYNHIALIGDVSHVSDVPYGGLYLGQHRIVVDRLLARVGLDANQSLVTSVFSEPPEGGRILSNFITRGSAQTRGIEYNQDLMPFMWNRKRYYLKVGLEPELTRLQQEITKWSPRVLVTFGAAALWALTGTTHLGKYHGKRMFNELTGYGLVYPTFSPASVGFDKNREYSIIEVLTEAKKSASVRWPRALFERLTPVY